MLVYEIPLNEIVLDFYDRLKSVSRGYASLDYHFTDYKEGDLVKLDVLVSGEPVDALSLIMHRSSSNTTGIALTKKMKELIPRQMFEVPDPSRYRQQSNRPPNRQSNGQKRHRQMLRRRHFQKNANCSKSKRKAKKTNEKKSGRVEIPQEAFLAVLKVNEG